MTDNPTPPETADRGTLPLEAQDRSLALHDEEIAIVRRQVARATVRVSKTTSSRPHLVQETLTHQRVEVERVPINAYVDAAPPLRQEGDVTILSVVEEVVVTERRLLLKEEVRMRRVQTVETYAQTVVLRAEDATIERIPAAT